MRSRGPLGKVDDATPVMRLSVIHFRIAKAAIIFNSLARVARMAKPMQVAHIISTASVAG
jgi:hypothetical protein